MTFNTIQMRVLKHKMLINQFSNPINRKYVQTTFQNRNKETGNFQLKSVNLITIVTSIDLNMSKLHPRQAQAQLSLNCYLDTAELQHSPSAVIDEKTRRIGKEDFTNNCVGTG